MWRSLAPRAGFAPVAAIAQAAAPAPAIAAARRLGRRALLLGLGTVLLLPATLLLPNAVRADVRFDDCVTGSDGSVTCNTRPEGNTLMDDEAARFGLLDGGDPGWPEFNPGGDGGMGDGFGDGYWP